MHNIRTIIRIGIIAVVLVGLALYTGLLPFNIFTPGSGAYLPEGTYAEHAPYYDITAEYARSTPLLQSVGTQSDATAVSAMRDFIADTITQFKHDGDFANLTPEDIKTMGLGGDRKETLQINYLAASSARTVSYIFNTYTDTLGAHGNTSYRTFTFDTTTGKLLTLTDLFVPNASYLTTLSALSRAKLPSIIGEAYDTDMIAGGTLPKDASFAHFFLDGNSFVLLFPPYAVAPYAAGPQTLPIPLQELKSILRPEYQ